MSNSNTKDTDATAGCAPAIGSVAELLKRIETLEAKVEYLYAGTRCESCGKNEARELHECHGYDREGIMCNCCRSCTSDCAQSN